MIIMLASLVSLDTTPLTNTASEDDDDDDDHMTSMVAG